MRLTIVALTFGLLVATGAAASKSDAMDSGLAAARAAAPDVLNWTVVADGFYEGTSTRGEHVRHFSGLNGARLDLSGELSKLRNYSEAKIAHLKSGGGDSKNLARAIEISTGRVTFLQEIVDNLSRQQSAKVVQTRWDYSSNCGWDTYGESVFEANDFVMVDDPSARAMMESFGYGTFGPYPPLPLNVYREVYAQAGGDAINFVSDYENSTAAVGSQIVADAGDLTFGGTCVLKTIHSTAVQCNTGAWQYDSLQRDQTCAGVIDGLPPIES